MLLLPHFFVHSVEISDSSSKEDDEVALLRETLSLSAVFLSLAFFAYLHSLTESLEQATQNTERK